MPPVQLQPSRPATPSRSVPSGHGSPLDMGNRVVFATRAVIALREQCGSLGKQLGQNPFLSLLSKILLDVETRLDSATPLKESRVLRLLTDLERLSNWPSFREPKSPSIQTYPRLTRLLNGQPQHIRNSIRLLAGCSSNAASRDRTTFRKTFEAFANVKCGPRGPEISDLVSNPKPPPHDDTTECLQRLYLTLHKTCRCAATSEGKDFKANIALEVIPPSPDLDGVKVDVFFRHRHISNDEIDEWKEAQIRVLLERFDSESRNMKPKSVRFEHPGERVPDFCSLIRSRNLGRLSLSAFNHAFFDDGFPLPPSKKALSLRTPSISLAQVLTSPSLRNDNQCKLLLSYFLAKAVWQFYGSDWMTESWTKHTVHFMRQHLTKMQKRVQLYPKPFISADLGGSTPQPGPMPAKKQHIFPKILALGIMLLEIELGQDIENLHTEEVYDEGQLRKGAEYFTAGRFLISEEWKARSKIFGPVKRVIEICITPNRSKPGTDPMEVRNKLYQVVVLPLRELFTYSWEYTPEDFQPEPIILAHMEHDTALTSYLDAAVSASSTPKPTRPSSNQSLSSSESQYPPPDSTPTDSSPVDLDRQYIHRDIPQITKQLFNLDVSVRSNYTIGWFCAISIELAAVCAMLDEVHDTPPMGPLQDIIYKFGRIGCHNVVIACLPAGSYGNISAAAVGKEMKLRFSGLRFGLMVGIGGGIPRDESGTSSASTDLHLGDVVVGIPTGDSGGVFQYDRGKTIDGGRFIHTGSLRKPPDILLSAVSNIQATPPQNLNEKLGQRVSEVQKVDCRLGYPGQKHDQLFHANYEHKEEGASCKLCDSTKLVNRRPRENHHPCVHYGVIASGGQVVRHGPTRDKIGRESRALCFEMEAAGLMDVLPCLIVRGISDYSDSHKSDLWQGYAAATAAAFTKELLLEIPALASS